LYYKQYKRHTTKIKTKTTMIRSSRGKKKTINGLICPSSTVDKNNIVQMWKSVPLFTITESQYLETINDDRSNSSCYDFYPFSLIRIGRSTNEISRDALDLITGIEEVDGLKHTEEDEKTVGTTSITDDESDDEDDEDGYDYTPPPAQQELYHT
jgi:hypothetical protein